jgi:hypothetical protein
MGWIIYIANSPIIMSTVYCFLALEFDTFE